MADIWKILRNACIWSESPSYNAVRQWLLKVGLFKLQQNHVDGTWMLVVDSTIQMGRQKVLLVLGVRVERLGEGYNPSFEDAQPLVMKVVEKCPGEIVKEALVEAMGKVESVAGIVSDGGSEMKRGTRLLCESGLPVLHVGDVVHLMSNLLKAELAGDNDWLRFKEECRHMIQTVKLSPLAHLAPPCLRARERLMASTTIVEWGQRHLAYVSSLEALSKDAEEKLTWILRYRELLSIWGGLIDRSKLAIKLVQEQGYHNKICSEWENALSNYAKGHPRVECFAASISQILKTEGEKMPEGKACLGSSVIIESGFGKFKHLEDHHESSGITSLVLALPALFGVTDERALATALSSISVKDLKEWQDQNLGQTYLSKRKAALKPSTIDLDACDLFTCQMA